MIDKGENMTSTGASSTPDLPVRSVTVAEVIDAEGRRVIEISTDGEPSVWDVLGFVHYADEACRQQIRASGTEWDL